jgi:Flp pilus assembly pilin Flp
MPRHAPGPADDAGQGLIEYALILGLTSLGIVLALLVLRNSIVSPVQGSSDRLEAAGMTVGLPAAGDPAGAAGGGATGGHGNGQGNSGNGNGNGGPNGGNNGHSGDGNHGNGNGNGGPQ